MSIATWDEDDRRTIDYYTRLIGRYGIDPRALDWGGPESQRLRFAVLAGIGPLEGATILDVGCGQGDFYGWLLETGVRVDYHGIDITPGMVETARDRFPGGRFEVRNPLESPLDEGSYDYVFASGVFYLRQHEPLAFLRRIVEAMFAGCRSGIAFNSLSAWAPQKDEGEFYADPLDVLAYCRALSPRMVLRHDYHPRDFSILLYKDLVGASR